MQPVRLLLTAWALTGLGAVIGSILGNAAGGAGLFAGAVVGGVLGIATAVAAAAKLQWLAREDRLGGLIGGMVGFAVAAPIAVANLHTPVTPILICSLAGLGVLLGVGLAQGWREQP